MMKAILLDDDRSNSEILSKILEMYCPHIAIVGMPENIDQAMLLIKEHKPDLIFLDVDLQAENGFDMVPLILHMDIEIIFVTAYDQYILQALRANAVDYLLKPIDIKELIKAVKRAEEKLAKKTGHAIQSTPAPSAAKTHLEKKIVVPSAKGYEFIPVSDITRLEANGAYTIIFTADSRKVMVSRNIKEYELILPDNTFVRVHRGHIVNIDYVKYYFKGRGGYVEMLNGTAIQVSSRKKAEFLHKFGIRSGE